MNIGSRLHVIGILILAGTPMAHGGQPTFRVGCLEYSGHTGLKDSDKKMEVLYEGLTIALATQAKAGTPVDLIVTGEFPTFMGSEDGMENMAQVIPGPRTDELAAIAAKHHVWLVADLLESDASASQPRVYNAAVVFDRAGELVAKYRKVRLSPSETERGMQAGTRSMVVDTEFGPVVPIVCWEVQFADYISHVIATAQRQGRKPHLIVHPTAGEFAKELPKIAREYRVHIASAAWDGPSRVISSDGTILDEQLYKGGKAKEMKLAVADIPLAVQSPATHPAATQRTVSPDGDAPGTVPPPKARGATRGAAGPGR